MLIVAPDNIIVAIYCLTLPFISLKSSAHFCIEPHSKQFNDIMILNALHTNVILL